MKRRLPLVLAIATAAVLLVLVSFLAGSMWGPWTHHSPNAEKGDGGAANGSNAVVATPGKAIARTETANPPPPPKSVANPDRVRQNLKPGKTYITHTTGTLHVRATDKDWGVEQVVTLNYAFEAFIDREIESNDGTTIVELRHFRDIRSVKVLCTLEDVRLDLPPLIGDRLLPELQGLSGKPLINALRWKGISPEKLFGLGDKVKDFQSVDRMAGKKVRLTYIDGKGVSKVESVQGDMTAGERDFHMASVLVSDSLIVPNIDIKLGNRWSVDGSNFTGLMDPGLLARTAGEIELERVPDHIVGNKLCRHLKVVGGSLLFDDSNPKVGRIGHFEPSGSLYFSPEDQIIVQAKLQGKATLDKFSKDHLLFEAQMRHRPELVLAYSCHVVDTLQHKMP